MGVGNHPMVRLWETRVILTPRSYLSRYYVKTHLDVELPMDPVQYLDLLGLLHFSISFTPSSPKTLELKVAEL